MKRLLSAIMAIMIAFMLLPPAIPVSAEGTVKFTLSPAVVEVSPGDVFTLTLSCRSDIAVETYESWVRYDDAVFEVLELVGYNDIAAVLNPYPGCFFWGESFEPASVFTGEMGYVRVRVRDNAEAGSYVFSQQPIAHLPDRLNAAPSEANAVTVKVVRQSCSQNGGHNYVSSVEKKHPHEILFTCTKCGDQYQAGEDLVVGCADCEEDLFYDYIYTYKDETYHQKEYVFPDYPGQSELEKHGWYEDSVTKPATCKKTGIITYTCICKGTKTEIIPKKAHSFEETWSTGEDQHWKACADCDEKEGAENHKYANACAAVCDVCGYTRENAHDIAENWQTDETNHWHSCAICLEKLEQQPHSVDESGVCTVCSYGETAPPETEPVPATQPPATSPQATEPSNPVTVPSASVPETQTVPKEERKNMTVHYVVIACAVVVLIGCTVLLITQIRSKASDEDEENISDGEE